MNQFAAKYFDGQSAKHSVVIIKVYGDEFTISKDHQEIHRLNQRQVHIDRSQNKKTIVHLSSGEMLEVEDPNFMRQPSFSFAESHGNYVIYVVVFIFIALFLWFKLDSISVYLAKQVPFKWEQKAIKSVDNLMVFDYCKDPTPTKILNDATNRLKGVFPHPIKTSIIVDKNPNAFALPGGQMLVTTGLLDFVEGPTELTAVMAHEIGHISERHSLAALIRISFLTLLWNGLTGDFSGIFVFDPATALEIIALKFNRDMETDADRFAIRLLRNQQISTEGAAAFFTRLKKKADIDALSFLSSHPANSDRIELFLKYAKKNHRNTLFKTSEWKKLKAACR